MGKIRVPAYKDEPEELINGQHEPLISEETFYKVQDVLDGKKKHKPKLERAINPDLFLRRFVCCPICGHGLTGSTSRGNGGQYTYYNCSKNPKHLRIRAEKAIELFSHYLGCLKPNKAVLRLYEEILKDINCDVKKGIEAEITTLRKQLSEKQKAIENVEDLLINNKIGTERFNKMTSRIENEIKELENRISMLETNKQEKLEPKISYAISLISNLDKIILDAPVETKIKLIGSIFDEKIVFDGKSYRTNSINKVIELIFQDVNGLRGSENENRKLSNENLRFSTQSRGRTGTGCPTGV